MALNKLFIIGVLLMIFLFAIFASPSRLSPSRLSLSGLGLSELVLLWFADNALVECLLTLSAGYVFCILALLNSKK